MRRAAALYPKAPLLSSNCMPQCSRLSNLPKPARHFSISSLRPSTSIRAVWPANHSPGSCWRWPCSPTGSFQSSRAGRFQKHEKGLFHSPSARVSSNADGPRIGLSSLANPALTMQGNSNPLLHRAYVALGSNMGHRVAMIEQACRAMEARAITIKRTSSLFETAPMYVVDQDPFVNGVCEVETYMSPMELLDTLQSIESEMGRRKVIDKGPRVIDLDILLYDNQRVSNDRLNIPHQLMLEREFVLRPLCQLIPRQHPSGVKGPGSYLTYLNKLPTSYPVAVTPLAKTLPTLDTSGPNCHTHIMAILNVTPDSFSDGGIHTSGNPEVIANTIREYVQAGATIIDVGGESTRPGSDPIPESVELSRVIPAIKLIRSLPECSKVAISIDTYRASVAEAAVAAGADIINDISAGLMDPCMLSTMARLQKTVILSHMRGTPKTMSTQVDYPDGVLAGVRDGLSERIAAAEAAGVRRWRIIADPGIGFAKNEAQNLTLLREFNQLRESETLRYLPWLVGTSRKGFIGSITGVDKPSERTWGTAAAITAAIAKGTDIVRVHDVRQMAQVALMADALFREH